MIHFNNFTEEFLWENAAKARKIFLKRIPTRYKCSNRASLTNGRDLNIMMANFSSSLGADIRDKLGMKI